MVTRNVPSDEANAILRGEPSAAAKVFDFEVPGTARPPTRNFAGTIYKVGLGYTSVDLLPGPSVPTQGKAKRYTITLTPLTLPYIVGGARNGSKLVAVVTYGSGETSAQFAVNLTTLARRVLEVTATRVEVNFYNDYSPVAAAQGGSSIAAFIAEDAIRTSDFYAWSSGVVLASGSRYGTLATAPGVLGQWRCILTAAAAGGTPLYPSLYDCIPASGQPPANTPAIPGSVLDPVFNAGDGRAYDDSIAPGWINWGDDTGTQLVFGLSSDPFKYVDPGAGNAVRVDAKVGQ